MPASHELPGSSETPSAASGPVSSALVRVTRLHVLRARQLLTRLGLHPGHELLLMQVWERGPQRQSELVATFNTDSASMTRTVQRLERSGYLRRRPHPTDGRVTLVESTPAGDALRAQIDELWTELEAATVGNMTHAHQRRLLADLHSIETNLAATPGRPTLQHGRPDSRAPSPSKSRKA